MNWVIFLILILLLCGGISSPIGPWNHGYGWYPSGGAGLLVLILIILLVLGRI